MLRRLSSIVSGLMLIIIGMACLWGAWKFSVKARNWTHQGVKATGRVDRLEKIDRPRRQNNRGPSYAPVVVFLDSNGAQHEFTSTTSSSPPAYKPGEQVGLYYEPRNPSIGQINSFSELWLPTVIFGVMGFLVFSGGVAQLFFPSTFWYVQRRPTLIHFND